MITATKQVIYYKCEYCEFESDRIDSMNKHEELHKYAKSFETGDKVIYQTGDFVEKETIPNVVFKLVDKNATVLDIDIANYKLLLETEDGSKEWAYVFNVEHGVSNDNKN